MTHLTAAEFGAAFDTLFQGKAFRAELRDYYYADNEAVPFWRFRSGQPQDAAWREPWKQYVREAIAGGKQMARVHAVREPLSDYLEFEFTCVYPANVAAGEDVRVLRLRSWPHLILPDHDFWLFDDRAVVMNYDEYGNFTGADVVSDPQMIARYRQVRDRLMQHSVPLADYLAAIGMKEAV